MRFSKKPFGTTVKFINPEKFGFLTGKSVLVNREKEIEQELKLSEEQLNTQIQYGTKSGYIKTVYIHILWKLK